eukprot:9840426-Alexandrium_andersonii.AAC.1
MRGKVAAPPRCRPILVTRNVSIVHRCNLPVDESAERLGEVGGEQEIAIEVANSPVTLALVQLDDAAAAPRGRPHLTLNDALLNAGKLDRHCITARLHELGGDTIGANPL